MAAMTYFGLYSNDGLVQYPFNRAYPLNRVPPPVWRWTQLPVEETLDGQQAYGLYKTVEWDFTSLKNGITIAQYDLFDALRQSGGAIRFCTRNNLGQWVECTGIVDRILPAQFNWERTRAHSLVVTFNRVREL